MAIEIQAPRITSKESPREIIAADFKSVGELPIRGGWGYSFDDAVIIDKNDPIVPAGLPFDGVGIEYVFVEKRIYEELIIFRPQTNRFSGIEWDMLKQQLITKDPKHFDVLSFVVKAFPEKAWDELKTKWEGPNGFQSPRFDADAHMQQRDSMMVKYTTEYYFDITSFFGTT